MQLHVQSWQQPKIKIELATIPVWCTCDRLPSSVISYFPVPLYACHRIETVPLHVPLHVFFRRRHLSLTSGGKKGCPATIQPLSFSVNVSTYDPPILYSVSPLSIHVTRSASLAPLRSPVCLNMTGRVSFFYSHFLYVRHFRLEGVRDNNSRWGIRAVEE